MGPGGGLRPRPRPRHEAKRQLRGDDGQPRVRERALPRRSGLSRHPGGGRQGAGAPAVGNAGGRPLARVRTERSGVRGLDRHRRRDADASHGPAGHPAVPARICERPRGGHRRGGRSGPRIPGRGSRRIVRRRGRERSRVPLVRLYPAVPDVRSRHAVGRGCRRLRAGPFPVLRKRDPDLAADVDHRRAVALHRRRPPGQLARQGPERGSTGRTTG